MKLKTTKNYLIFIRLESDIEGKFFGDRSSGGCYEQQEYGECNQSFCVPIFFLIRGGYFSLSIRIAITKLHCNIISIPLLFLFQILPPDPIQ